ncbi:MAG: hypothetical protein COT84_03170 [Chlamydiae bacterium CG10_big_fil_rev_8_21_14_0_10_35_9]|nr:MAG: hypothetical protein COT84_03170 [Chlamydiae bacterium CG10_big_fil_rev_8_21_14_0_10_35_9]
MAASASSRIDNLIAHSVQVEGCDNPVAYEESHTLSYGYWICSACKSSFFAGGQPLHKQGCSLEGKVKEVFTCSGKEMIYVLGPQESGFYSPFGRKEIESIKELAKAQFSK